MFCLHCGTENQSDSKFCKECGALVGAAVSSKMRVRPVRSRLSPHIAEDLGAEENENPQLQRLMELALRHSQTGNTPGAILACETALLIDADNCSSLSLLGCLYERQGEIDKAIAVFERVVQISPDSVADISKLDALKRGEFLPPVPQPIIYRQLPSAIMLAFTDSKPLRIGAAVVVGLLILGGGLAIIIPHRHAADHADSTSIAPLNLPAVSTPSEPIVETHSIGSASIAPARNSVPAPPFTAPLTIVAASSHSIASEDSASAVPNAPLVRTATPNLRKMQLVKSANQPIPPLSVAAAGNASVPSVTAIQPLGTNPVKVFSDSSLPEHTVVIGAAQPANNASASQPGSNSGIASASGQDIAGEQPALPQSHIYVHVHQDSHAAASRTVMASAVPLPLAAGSPNSSAAASKGASLQSQALQAQQKSDYKSAARFYRAAISAYRREVSQGEFVSEAQRGIEACETGLQICQEN